MFNSSLEVAKFEGASIKTVSGIRGQVKKALKANDGSFRATFEDKVLRSDLVVLRAWVPVPIPTLYNPIHSLLVPSVSGRRGGYLAMRSTAEMRAALGVPVPTNSDSSYKPIERSTRRFNPLVIPKALQAALPFKSKPKQDAPHGKRHKSLQARRPVVTEPEERQASSFMQQIATNFKNRLTKRKVKAAEKRQVRHAKLSKDDEATAAARKKIAKKRFVQEGLDQKKKARVAARSSGGKDGGGDD